MLDGEQIYHHSIGDRTVTDKIVGSKFDGEKPDWSLIDLDVIEQIVNVLNFGKKKYGKNNWRHLENAEERYFAAMLRHLTARQAGELYDSESGLPHLAHAGCCLFFMMWFDQHRTGKVGAVVERAAG